MIKWFNCLSLFVFFLPIIVLAQTNKNYNAPDLLASSRVYILPEAGEFTIGSTFESNIYIDTNKNNINVIDLEVVYDPTRVQVVNSVGSPSIFGIWVDLPYYDNKKGVAGMSGIITNGLRSKSILIGTITFKVVGLGQTSISVADTTQVNLNDGYGTLAVLRKGRANYYLKNKAPDAVTISSQTHSNIESWYLNNNPHFSWQTNNSVDGFSVLLDQNPLSVPEEKITTQNNFIEYQNVADGLWYLHVRSFYRGLWGETANYLVKIDTSGPAKFKPTISNVQMNDGSKNYLISFFTTDKYSGLDRFEVVLDGNYANPTLAQSPYLLTQKGVQKISILAYDKVGNVTEESINLYNGVVFVQKFKYYLIALAGLVVTFLLYLVYKNSKKKKTLN